MKNEFNYNNLTTLLALLQEAKINLSIEVSEYKKVFEIDYLTFDQKRLEKVFGKQLFNKTLTQAQVDMFRNFIYKIPLNNDNFLKAKDKAWEETLKQETSIREKARKRIDSFKPSTHEEISAFNLKKGDKFEIELSTHCPFTWQEDISTVTGCVNDEMILKDNLYKLYFEFVDDYGQDSYCTFDNVKIIKKFL